MYTFDLKPDYRTFDGKRIKSQAIKTISKIYVNEVKKTYFDMGLNWRLNGLRIKDLNLLFNICDN